VKLGDGAASLAGDNGTPQFQFTPNAVAYPGLVPEVIVNVSTGQHIREPATLKYRFLLEDGTGEASFLAASDSAGFLQFNPGELQQAIKVPIDWDRVPASAQYRLKLHLNSFINSRVLNQTNDVGLHVFGVPPGTCPPGTSRKQNSTKGADFSQVQNFESLNKTQAMVSGKYRYA